MENCVISESANVATDTKVGAFVVIGDNARIGKGCVIGNNVIIHGDTEIGDNVRIDDNTIVGKAPMRAANSAVTKDQQLPACIVGSNCIVGTNVVVYRGCRIGQKVLIADLSTVRENVTIGDYTIVGRGGRKISENFK